MFFQMKEKMKQLYMNLESKFMTLIEVEVNPKLLDIKDTSEKVLCHQYFAGYIHNMSKDIPVSCLNWEMEPYSPFSRANTQANVRFKFKENCGNVIEVYVYVGVIGACGRWLQVEN